MGHATRMVYPDRARPRQCLGMVVSGGPAVSGDSGVGGTTVSGDSGLGGTQRCRVVV